MKKNMAIIMFCVMVCAVLMVGCEDRSEKILPNIRQELAANQEMILENAEGSKAVIRFTSEVLDDEYMEYLYQLECGGTKAVFPEYARIVDSQLYRMDGIWYAAVTYDMASSDYVTEIFQIEGENMKKIQELEATIENAHVESNEFVMNFSKNVLGTYGATKRYAFREGKFETEDAWYVVTAPVSERTPIVNTRDMAMTIDGEECIIEKGTEMYVMRISDTSVELQIGERKEYAILEVEIDSDGYVNIDGMIDWDCFEMLPYAG